MGDELCELLLDLFPSLCMTGDGIPSWRLTKSKSEEDADLWLRLCLRLVAGRDEYLESCLISSLLIFAPPDVAACPTEEFILVLEGVVGLIVVSGPARGLLCKTRDDVVMGLWVVPFDLGVEVGVSSRPSPLNFLDKCSETQCTVTILS